MKMSGTSEHTAFYVMIKSYLPCPLRDRKVRVFPLACGFSPFCFDLQSLKSLFALFLWELTEWYLLHVHDQYAEEVREHMDQQTRFWSYKDQGQRLGFAFIDHLTLNGLPWWLRWSGRSPVFWPWPWINDQISWASRCQISCCLVHTLGIRVIESLSQTVRHW